MFAFIVALLPGFIAALPLFGHRFIPTHDGEYHIIRFWQFFRMLSEGIVFPRWAPDLNNGFGIPLFTFQYPFPNYIGSLFHITGLSFVDSFKWTLAAGYLTALVFCFLWLKRMFGKVPAAVGTIACAFVPYWFLDIYIRGSVGEVWAIAWVFAALYAISSGRRLIITIAVGLLIISHNITALIFVPILIVYSRSAYIRDVLLGIGLSAYFWIPAIFELQFIKGLSPVTIFDHFPELHQLIIPSWGSGFRGSIGSGNEMSYQIGIAPLIIFLVSPKRQFKFFYVLFVSAIFLITPWSEALWRFIPFVHFVQYPWRLLSLVVLCVPVFAAVSAKSYRYGWILAAVSIITSFGYSRPVTYEPRADIRYLANSEFTSGTSSLGNAFQTTWFSEKKESYTQFNKISHTLFVAHIEASQSATLIAPITYYPGWLAKNGNQQIDLFPSSGGRISLLVPKGKHNIRIWLAPTPWQRIAGSISVVSLSVAFVSFILKKNK